MSNPIARNFNTSSLLKFVFPSMMMMLIISLHSMAGSIYVGNFVSQDAMAAMNVVSPYFTAVVAVAVMFATGANAIIAKNLGEGKPMEAKEKLSYLYVVAMITGIITTLIALIFDDEILKFLGSTPQLNEYAKEYLRSLSLTFPFIFLQIFGQYFNVTVGKPMLGLAFGITSTISNVLITHITVVNLGLGVTGAAIGLGSSFFLPGVAFVILLFINKNWPLSFVKPKRYKGFMSEVCFNGSSEMVVNLAISIITMILNLLMKSLHGEDGIASVTVIVSLQFFLNSMYIGFGAGVAPIFAFAKGNDNRAQIKNVFKISTRFVIISSAILVLVCSLMKHFIVGVFIDSSSPAFNLAITAFQIFAIGYLFAGFNIFSSVFFTSMSNGKISALISFLRTFAFIIGMLLILPKLFGTIGVWVSIPIAEFLAVIVSALLLKKHKDVYHY